MTFNDMVYSTTIEGSVRVSSYDDEGKETVHFEGDVWCGLGNIGVEDEWGEREVSTVFASDSVLHVELD